MKRICFFMLCLTSISLLMSSCDIFEHDDEIMAEIPEAVQAYITEHYPEYAIDEAEEETLCDGTAALEIELEKGEDEIELIFSAENVLLYEEVEINKSDLPSAVTDAIAANYADHNLDEEAERLEFPDGSIQYEVELKNGTTELDVLYAADGTFICEEEDID